MPDKPKPGAAPLRKLRLTDWSRLFLSELAATSNVSAAARKAGVCTSTTYEARRQSAEFNRAWQQALCEGYDLLEMDLLRRLLEGEIKPAAGAKRGVRTYDNATPPTSPQEGQAWLVAASPTGAWSGQAGKIASFQQGQWMYQTPRDGLRVFNRATGQELLYFGSWKTPAKPASPSGGTVIDAQARTAIAALIDSLVAAGVLPAQ